MFEIQRTDPSYPPLLQEIQEPPQKIWGEGEPSLLTDGIRVAIVGSRQATPYGLKVAFDFAKELAERGVIIVSGLAYGIDTAAHEGALAAGGKTIAVLGCGLNFPYPKKNLSLKKKIASSGTVISEFSPETESAPWTFPQRNRIISGLSRAVIVVEADEKSGSLITARWALDQGREVFAVPGPITSPMSRGCNRLIQNGSFPLLSVEELFDQLKLPFAVSKKSGYNPQLDDKERLLASLKRESQSMDEIIETTGMEIKEISSLLVTLEIEGKIRSLPGGRFEVRHG